MFIFVSYNSLMFIKFDNTFDFYIILEIDKQIDIRVVTHLTRLHQIKDLQMLEETEIFTGF